MTDRAQAHTLEGIAAALLLVSSLVFALQTTAVTPLSASTSSQYIEDQLTTTSAGVLTAAAKQGALRRAVLFWNDSAVPPRFYGAEDPPSYTGDDHLDQFTFGRLLLDAFGDRRVVFNVYVSHQTKNHTRERLRMLYRGEPSDHAATATYTVTLYDDDTLYADVDGDGVAEPTDVSVNESRYVDASQTTGVYNVLRVEVVAWRM